MPSLTADDIDDLLYFTRINDTQELQSTISRLATTHNCTPQGILEACIDEETGNTVLHYCAANGHKDLLSELLRTSGFSARLVNHQNAQGNTPMHWAAYNGHRAVVEALGQEGKADMWIKNAAGHLAMFEAERADHSDVVQYLLLAGGNKVEQTGEEDDDDEPSAEDEVGVQDGEEEGASIVESASTDTDMQETGPS